MINSTPNSVRYQVQSASLFSADDYPILPDMEQHLPAVFREIARVGADLWMRGWAEANAGNMSARLDAEDRALIRADHRQGEWIDLPRTFTAIEGELIVVTSTGASLREIDQHPTRHLGVIEVGSGGARYRTVWGFAGGAGPTSELLCHLAICDARVGAGHTADRAVVHAHVPALIALTNSGVFDTLRLSLVLWQTIAECLVLLPEGIGLVPWHLPGSRALADATGEEFSRRRVAVWQYQGGLAAAQSPTAAFELLSVAEKAAAIYLAAKAAGGEVHGLSVQQLRELARRFGVTPDDTILVL
jgi:rhamnulose-1-phosphate aldolase